MEEDNGKSYEIDSFHVNKVLHANIVNLTKKRKLEGGQLLLPLSKHKFRDQSSCFEHELPLAEDPKAEEIFHAHIIKGKTEEVLADRSELESTKDSNSFAGESDSMSVYAENKFEPEYPKAYTYAQPSTSSGSCSSNSFKSTDYSLDSRTVKEISVGQEEQMVREYNPLNLMDGVQFESASKSLEDQLQNFGKQAINTCSEYENDVIEQCFDEENEDLMLYSNGVTSDAFVLSSGRWSINQETRLGARKPTIDQEFEQYFSMLML